MVSWHRLLTYFSYRVRVRTHLVKMKRKKEACGLLAAVTNLLQLLSYG